MALAAVFAVAFGAVYLIRNGTAGLTGLWPGEDSSPGGFRREPFTLPSRPPLELGDVELLARLDAEYAKLTEAVVPSVVSIDTAGVRNERWPDGLGRQRFRTVPTQGQGSGVIVTHEGHVVTNHHVVNGQQQIQVTLHDGKVYPATMIGEDRLLDIAVLKIEGSGTKFQPLKFGDSSQVRRGQLVFAIGNPFGLGETVTQGIISAVERSLSDTQRDLLQTDAAINPGNSGGPLVNLQGEIIGINSAIYTPDRANPGFQGVGFSIPSNDVKDTLISILERGRPIRGYLGVRMYEGGVVVGVGSGSPAELAGLQVNDVVLAYDGNQILDTTQLINLVQRTKIGRKVPLRIWRGGKEMSLEATITESQTTVAEVPAMPRGKTRDMQAILRAIGVRVTDLATQERIRGLSGALVVAVSPDGLAAGRVLPGDLIFAVNESRISDSTQFYLYVSASAAVQVTSLHLVRQGQEVKVDLPVLPREEVAVPEEKPDLPVLPREEVAAPEEEPDLPVLPREEVAAPEEEPEAPKQ